MKKFKKSNCDKTQKLKWWQNSKTQIVIKLKNSKCDNTHLVTKLKLRHNSNCDKTQIVTKLRLLQNSNCDKTQIGTKLKWWQNSNMDNTQIVREKFKNSCNKTQIVTKLDNSNYDNTQKLKMWQNLKIEIWTKPKIWQISIYEDKKTLKGSFNKNILTRWQPMRVSLGSVLRFSRCFLVKPPK